MSKYNADNAKEVNIDSLAEYTESEYYVSAPVLLQAMSDAVPNFQFDESSQYASSLGRTCVPDGIVDIVDEDSFSLCLECALNADDSEMTAWVSAWACDNATQVNLYLFEASMHWDTDGYPTENQQERALAEAYRYFAACFNEQLPGVFAVWGVSY